MKKLISGLGLAAMLALGGTAMFAAPVALAQDKAAAEAKKEEPKAAEAPKADAPKAEAPKADLPKKP